MKVELARKILKEDDAISVTFYMDFKFFDSKWMTGWSKNEEMWIPTDQVSDIVVVPRKFPVGTRIRITGIDKDYAYVEVGNEYIMTSNEVWSSYVHTPGKGHVFPENYLSFFEYEVL